MATSEILPEIRFRGTGPKRACDFVHKPVVHLRKKQMAGAGFGSGANDATVCNGVTPSTEQWMLLQNAKINISFSDPMIQLR